MIVKKLKFRKAVHSICEPLDPRTLTLIAKRGEQGMMLNQRSYRIYPDIFVLLKEGGTILEKIDPGFGKRVLSFGTPDGAPSVGKETNIRS